MKKGRLEQVIAVAARTKNALIKSWEDTQSFKYNAYVTGKGTLPEGIGLTGLLLLAVAFREEPKVINDADKEKISKITETSIKSLRNYTADGYKIDPLADVEFFDKEHGYIDTLTWCLSSAILARYAERKKVISISGEIHQYILEMIAHGIKSLLDSQREDGTWGFMTDPESSKSLYFTYTANSSLADFFDYILGEIEEVEQINEADDQPDNADCEVIEYINSNLEYDVEEKAKKVRTKLQEWLLMNALPLIPKVASCTSLSDEEREKLGIWKHDLIDLDDGSDLKMYYNLYYAYYLIEMMVTSSVDYYYEDTVCQSKESIRKLAKYYSKEGLMTDGDCEYFFGYLDKGDEFAIKEYENLYNMCVEQAIHSTRNQYISASRTGDFFWSDETGSSELEISWAHTKRSVSAEARNVLKRLKNKLTDPSIASSALRANVIYSYYVTDTPDLTVERLFDDICADAYTNETPLDGKFINGLWDTVGYNLLVTERSIESIVDFYDYVRKFGEKPKKQKVTTKVTEKAPIESAIEQKIAEYLNSDAGKEIIANVAATAVSTPVVNTSAITSDIESLIDNILKTIDEIKETAAFVNPEDTAADEDDRLISALVMLYDELENGNLRRKISSVLDKTDKEAIKKTATKYTANSKDLFKLMVENIEDSTSTPVALYKKIKLVKL